MLTPDFAPPSSRFPSRVGRMSTIQTMTFAVLFASLPTMECCTVYPTRVIGLPPARHTTTYRHLLLYLLPPFSRLPVVPRMAIKHHRHRHLPRRTHRDMVPSTIPMHPVDRSIPCSPNPPGSSHHHHHHTTTCTLPMAGMALPCHLRLPVNPVIDTTILRTIPTCTITRWSCLLRSMAVHLWSRPCLCHPNGPKRGLMV